MDIQRIEAAANRLKGHARVTPLLSSPFLDDIAGKRVLVKAECLQHTGSFKYRGARSAVSALSDEQRKNGVIAYSSGNHAQGVALAARQYGASAVIIMPADAPTMKIENTRALGAEVVLYDRATEDRDVIGSKLSDERGLTLIRPYDEPEVIAGQGTCGLEIAAQAAELGVTDADVIVCCGGGGLTAATAVVIAEVSPRTQVYAAEPTLFDDTCRSLAAGDRLANPVGQRTICDAIMTPTPNEVTFPINLDLLAGGVTASDADVREAVRFAFEHFKIMTEPGAVVGLAAVLNGQVAIKNKTMATVITVGNIDVARFAALTGDVE